MADYFIQAALSNLLVSTLLALIAWSVQRRYQSVGLANLLWVIVLIKMVTPPLFALPLLEVNSVEHTPAVQLEKVPAKPLLVADGFRAPRVRPSERVSLPATQTPPLAEPDPEEPANQTVWLQAACVVWGLGSLILLVASSFRILRFHAQLKRVLIPATPEVDRLGERLGNSLKLRRMPEIMFAEASLSPFVWWMGGRPKIVLPNSSIDQLPRSDLRLVLAHELAHVKRRDHWVRWLEWLTLVVLWWNPVMWWARKELRFTEETACDALVVKAAKSNRHEYACSLLNMAELLATSGIRPPAIASAMTSGGIMEKRLTMIISENKRRIPTVLRGMIVAVTVGIFPLGLVYAQDFEAVERRLGGGVADGELTLEQAGVMMRALRELAERQAYEDDAWHEHEEEMEERKRLFMEMEREIDIAVESGQLSPEEAEEKLTAIRRELFGHEEEEYESDDFWHQADPELVERELHYQAAMEEVEEQLESGRISEEQAERLLLQIRVELFGDDDHDDGWGDEEEEEIRDREVEELEIRRRELEYIEVARQLEIAVKEGVMSAADAERELIELQMMLFGDRDDEYEEDQLNEDRAAQRELERKYRLAVEELEAAVEAGLISGEEAELKLREMQRRWFEAQDEAEQHEMERRNAILLEREYQLQRMMDDLEAAVEAGQLSAEEAEDKLNEVRDQLFGDDVELESDDRADYEAELEDRERQLYDVMRELESAVEAGHLSPEDAERKLIEIRNELFDGYEESIR